MVINSETTRVGSAIDRAFSIIGEDSKQKLIIYLRKTYGIDIYSPGLEAEDAIEKLQPAMDEIFSIGSSLIMQLVVAEIKKYS